MRADGFLIEMIISLSRGEVLRCQRIKVRHELIRALGAAGRAGTGERRSALHSQRKPAGRYAGSVISGTSIQGSIGPNRVHAAHWRLHPAVMRLFRIRIE